MYVVIGLGKTGVSCVRWLRAQGLSVRAMDTRAEPPGIASTRVLYPDVEVHTGGLRSDWLMSAEALVVSPGVAITDPGIAAAIAQGIPVLGDIELFARTVRVPVLGITGSNGKSTVTALLGEMARASGRRVAIGGNFGTPALDLLAEDAGLYVLELSSFQLETTSTLELAGATILNVSEDHLDRYSDMTEYAMAKQRIYAHAHVAVVNRDDRWSAPRGIFAGRSIGFGAAAVAHGFGIVKIDGKRTISLDGAPLIACSDLRISGTHNHLNAMAAMALGQAAGLPMEAMLAALRSFSGLPHRCRLVAEHDGVRWYNDSKGTNIGATAAALSGVAESISGQVVLIAGGLGKDQDFHQLDTHVRSHVRHVVLIGHDAPLIRAALSEPEKVLDANDMAAAVAESFRLAKPGDAVLLSPACASFDMYSGYAARGEDFERCVKARLCGEAGNVA